MMAGEEPIRVDKQIDGFRIRVWTWKNPRWMVPEEGFIRRYWDISKSQELGKIKWTNRPKGPRFDNTIFTEIEVLVEAQTEPEECVTRFIQLAVSRKDEFMEHIETVAGIIAMRLHPQFVLSVLADGPVAMRADGKNAVTNEIPVFEKVEPMQVSSSGGAGIEPYIERLGQYLPYSRALDWIQAGLRSESLELKFMAYFFALETILNSIEPPDAFLQYKREVKEFKTFVKLRSKKDEDFARFKPVLDSLAQNLRPTLRQRFETLAARLDFSSKERDCEAFKQFNLMRNELVHCGERKISTTVVVQDQVTELRTLAERYICAEVFGDKNIYPCSFRRVKQEHEEADDKNDLAVEE